MISFLLIDTCVWLDLIKNPNDELILSSMEELINLGDIQLIVPDLVKEEFYRNKDRVSDTARQRLSHEFKKVRNVIESFGNEINKSEVLESLDEVHHKLPIILDKVLFSIEKVESFFQKATKVTFPNDLYVNTSQRAIQKKAPFHKQKNSVPDALLMEIFYYFANKDKENNYIFITHNTNDFSDPIDNRKIHPDYLNYFDGVRIKYQINIFNVLKEIAPDSIELYFNEYDWLNETRSLTEILNSVDEFEQKVWYNRHCVLAEKISEGKIKIVTKQSSEKYNPNVILKSIWNGACKAAKNVEKKYSKDLGPWDDFEWGMINGKLSALRWILGDDWDMLDT